MTARLVVLASGSGTNLQAVIDACCDGRLNARVVAVIANRAGVPALDRAAQAGIPAHCRPLAPYRGRGPDAEAERRAYDAELAAEIADFAPDLIVQAGWMHVFSSEFLNHFPGAVVNLHPALPGVFPGAHAIDDAWAAHVRAGLDETGVMVHLVPDEGVDDGPVLATATVAIRPDDNRESLEARIHAAEHDLLVQAVGDYLQTR